MDDEELRRLARAHHVETGYRDWRGQEAQVSPETLRAVLASLGADGGTAAAERTAREPDRGAPAGPLPPPDRAWGFMTQLYSVRSRASCGIGDLRDLADLAGWSARLGSGFLLVNPLHAGSPVSPIEPSPYLPVSRRYTSPLYLRVSALPEFDAHPDRWTFLGRLESIDTLDRDRVWKVKDEILRALFALFTPDNSYRAYRRREGSALTGFATWCALAELYGADWRGWPSHEPGGARAERVEYHAWLQWRLDGQLADAQRTARSAGMPIGIVHDLAVGVHPGGADTWLYPDLFAPGMSVGAPPDEFNQLGQDWGQPPPHPLRIADDDHRHYRAMIAAALRHGGGLRLDHVMQLSRLWWVPEGAPPDQGAYVAYDRRALLRVLCEEAARADAVLIGEDLGTVEPSVREALSAHGVLGTGLLWFERGRRPGEWRESCLASVGSHDLPPIAGFLHGDHITLREELDLLTRPVAEERAAHEADLAGWFRLLTDEGLLDAGQDEAPAALLDRVGVPGIVEALHAYLARTPARLIGVSLADAAGERRTQNQPGTTNEYPNWRVPLPLSLEEIKTDPGVRAAIAPLTG
ncbi:4-alpha-glucanotransferase [Actinocorallia longicatena]|uniref:4-alpha-glucanotransferase n=1 Tax=Actinocorallia longicatena TaxID=111803 RepID=A0ABP6QGR6_9ACTN